MFGLFKVINFVFKRETRHVDLEMPSTCFSRLPCHPSPPWILSLKIRLCVHLSHCTVSASAVADSGWAPC